MRHECCECGTSGKRRIPIVKLVDGTILYVCLDCWSTYHYGAYIK